MSASFAADGRPGAYPLILMYHHIRPPPPGARIRGMYVRPRHFDGQIAWLRRRGYEFVTFGDLAAAGAGAVRGSARRVILTLDDGYADNYHNGLPILKRHGVRAVVYPVLGDVGRRGVVWPGATERTPADMLSADQIREMAAAGIEFGSHLIEHVSLRRMSPDEQVDQLGRSRRGLEELTGVPVLSIAYPYGDFDADVVERARAAGYRYGVITEPGVDAASADPLTLRRTTAKGCKLHHPLKFRRAVRRAEAAMDALRAA